MMRSPLASVCDRASVAATAVLQIITDAEQEPGLPPDELHYRLWRYLRDEFADIARETANDRGDDNET